MKAPEEYDDYLRRAAGLDLLDGPPPVLTLAQARAALLALAADADKYCHLLLRAVRPPAPANGPPTLLT